MLKNIKYIISVVGLVSVAISAIAGNESRRGQAASELLINPWGRSSGYAGAYTAGIKGVEAMQFNVGGLSGVRNMEITFTNTQLWANSGMTINSFGFAKKVGDNGGALGLSVTNLNFGEFLHTTEYLPDGSGLIFKPQSTNIAIAYSKVFSRSIKGGLLIRTISQNAPRVSALGICFDAGLQYSTKLKKDSPNMFEFGVALRNVGPDMRYTGDGLSRRGSVFGTNMVEGQTINQRSDQFALSSLMNIGIAYNMVLVDSVHYLTVSGNFNSNSYTRDQLQFGVEYGFKKIIMLRAGLDYQKYIFSSTKRNVVHTGPCAGITLALPYGEEKVKQFMLNYSYRTTASPFNGTHSMGLTLSL